jgi:predicted Zn-dependent protease
MRQLTKSVLILFIITTLFQYLYSARAEAAFSVGDEKKVGEQLLTLIRREFKLIDEPDIIQYINELGRSTLEVAGPQFFDYHFFVINNKELNAFAAPSGLIFFHTGLIESLDSEGELVGVVAHEIGHVASRHLASRFSKGSMINAATTLGVLLGVAIGGGALSEALISGSMAAGQSAYLSFSRLDEEEADRLAFNWMRDQNRDPEAMVEMLRKLHNISRYRHGYIPPYLMTHPRPDIRMSYIQDLTLFTDQKTYVQVDEFEFQRFKSRIMSITKEPMQLINYHENSVSFLEPGTPKAAMGHYLLSQSYLAAGNYVQAENELRKTMTIYPDKSILKADLGVIYLNSGQYKNALVQLQEARKADRNNAYATFNLAQVLEKTGELKGATDLYEELLITMPDFSQLYYQLANVNALLGNQGEVYYYNGFYHWYEGDLKSAKYNYSKAVTLLPQDTRMRADAESMLQKIVEFEKER